MYMYSKGLSSRGLYFSNADAGMKRCQTFCHRSMSIVFSIHLKFQFLPIPYNSCFPFHFEVVSNAHIRLLEKVRAHNLGLEVLPHPAPHETTWGGIILSLRLKYASRCYGLVFGPIRCNGMNQTCMWYCRCVSFLFEKVCVPGLSLS